MPMASPHSHYDYYSLVFDLIPAHAKVKTHCNSLWSTRGFTDASYTTHLNWLHALNEIINNGMSIQHATSEYDISKLVLGDKSK